jgi:serine/threonine protein kinase
VRELSGYKTDFPQFECQQLGRLVKNLDDTGLDLLEKMLKSNPAERITAKDALKHPYLNSVSDEIRNLK